MNDPRSRKAQFMVNHLMAEHRSALSQRLDELRAQSAMRGAQQQSKDANNQQMCIFPQLEHHQEELQVLGHLEALSLASLPNDVLHQVGSGMEFKFFFIQVECCGNFFLGR